MDYDGLRHVDPELPGRNVRSLLRDLLGFRPNAEQLCRKVSAVPPLD